MTNSEKPKVHIFTVDYKQTIIKKLRALRDSNALSSRALAALIGSGLTTPGIHQYVSGISLPTGKRFLTLNDFFMKSDDEISKLVAEFKATTKMRTYGKNKKDATDKSNIKAIVVLLNNIMAKQDAILQRLSVLDAEPLAAVVPSAFPASRWLGGAS